MVNGIMPELRGLLQNNDRERRKTLLSISLERARVIVVTEVPTIRLTMNCLSIYQKNNLSKKNDKIKNKL